MLPPSTSAKLDFERDLLLISGDDEYAAGEAFRRLWAAYELRLKKMLLSWDVSADDADDQIQTARIRLWKRRTTLDVPSPGAWWGLIRRVCWNLAVDSIRSRRPTEMNVIPEADLPYVDVIAEAAQDLRRIYEAADNLWLGEASTCGESALFAAQLYFQEGFDRDAVAHLVGVGRRQVEAWLDDPGVLARFAYHELLWSNDDLAGYVLKPDGPLTSSELDALSDAIRDSDPLPLEGWEANEALVILLRIRNGLLSDQILRFEKCGMDAGSLDLFLNHLRSRFPFEEVARRLHRRLESHQEDDILRNQSLWKRLAFQYHASAELPNRQIWERTKPAADVVGAKVTEPMLNNWLGLGRLWSQLAAHVQSEEEK